MAGFRITIAGDSAINLEFARTISPQTSGLIRSAARTLEIDPIAGIIELVPTFCSLMITYDPLVISYDELVAAVTGKLVDVQQDESATRRIVKIPVCYGGEYGPDMQTVCEHAHMREEDVIALHSSKDYLIDILGFMPGFAYLGGLDERLHTPRLATPRTVIEAGSVGIGGAQTGIYPLASPGGWQLIGRSPIRPYDPQREVPILYSAGDYLRFVPISESEYVSIEKQVKEGTYQYDIIVEGA